MDSKLSQILSKLQIEQSYLSFLESGKLVEQIYNQKEKLFIISLNLDLPLPYSVYENLLNSFKDYLQKKDKEVQTILNITLNTKEYDSKVIKDYIMNYIKHNVEIIIS